MLFTHGGETEELITETSCRWGYSYVAWSAVTETTEPGLIPCPADDWIQVYRRHP